MRVLIVGASPKPERYAYLALQQLLASGHETVLFNPSPAHTTIEGLRVHASLGEITGAIDTITLYVGSARLDNLIPELLALNPRRIISNPGTENQRLAQAARDAGIDYVEACTLILLRSGQF